MNRLLHENFHGYFNFESLEHTLNKDIYINYYKNNILVYWNLYRNSKLIERKDFGQEDRHHRVYEYHDNYKISTVYSKSGEISSKHMSFDNCFEINESTSFSVKENNFWKIKNLKNGIEEISIDAQDVRIIYRFKNNRLIELTFDIDGYEKSYIIRAEYDDKGRIIHQNKIFFKLNDDSSNEEKWFQYEDDLTIEKIHTEEKYDYKITLYDDEKRPLNRIGFIGNDDNITLVKKYIRSQDEENLKPIMKLMNLEVFVYDKFGNRTVYEEKFYRPDFSTDHLTDYIQDYKYFDKYNIEYGYFYCKTKTDYDDCSEGYEKLEYFKDKVHQYEEGQLVAIHYLENEKRIRSEFFLNKKHIFEKDEDGNTQVLEQDFDIIEKYDRFGNTIESRVKNKTTGETDYYFIEVI
ncbi:hypothetical protein GCM10023210_01500 [Chryseobacterium ginsengisoli]|uniref:Sugar-binding protein n=1 Tax=Chryseobacterium ginsengisoli TaxID=363853 RepID=A0ABP9LU37_9FLAO